MKKQVLSLLALLAVSSIHAASMQVIWGDASQSIPPIHQNNGVFKAIQAKQQANYQLKLLTPMAEKSDHKHYQITYKGIPVWGHHLVFHTKPGVKPLVTGINVKDIEKDVASIEGKLSPADIEQKILASVSGPIKYKITKKIIYLDPQDIAHLAYHVSFYTSKPESPISSPNYIVDANNGEILKQWNNAHHEKIGQGMGGNSLLLPYRSGTFQYGNAIANFPSLGKFDVDVFKDNCFVQNDSVRVVNLENAPLGYDAFPISVSDETNYSLGAFSYPCDANSAYVNFADGVTGPVNYAFSPVNDTMFFAQNTIEMYTSRYKVEQPLGKDLPLRAFTHLGEMDNAFAIPTIIDGGQLLSHQQIVIGNGDVYFTALSQSVIGHELSHNFTDLHSGLIYEGQSGGINEAFSDMAAIALQDYLRTNYPWYWDGKDWTIGRESILSGEPLRYMDDPTKDGFSIGDARDYNDNLDVHYSSGVFNKAFYLLAHQPGWSVRKAFQTMVDANQHYWQPTSDFNFAACGVIQATLDRGLDKRTVISVFDEVGVSCGAFA